MQEDIEHIGVSLFYLVEEDNGVGLAANSLSKLTALVVSDISGRRSDETADAEFLHVFAHVDTYHIALIVE